MACMRISDWILLVTAVILLATAIVAAYYAYETHRMRKAVVSQLDTSRKAALLSAYASLFQIHIRIIDKDSGDPVARQMEHYRDALATVSDTAQKIEQLVRELEKT
jgi:hypothetical protein